MAANKECLIIILDVRKSGNEEFKKKSVACAAEILKDKICSAKKDYVSFVLLGTRNTCNELNTNVFKDGYLNILEYPHVQLATWQHLINFFKFVEEDTCVKGEWLDAVVVAMEAIRKSQEVFKFHRQRIVLFCDFNENANNYNMFDVITENLMKCDIHLTVVSSNISYIDNSTSGAPQAMFSGTHKSDSQLENEKYALRLVTNCNAKLCNFKEALHTIFKVENKHPWVWNSKLCIGSKIKINISGVIAIKDESNIKIKKCWGSENEHVAREKKFYIKDKEVQPLDIDLIDGYMLGATPIAYDESLSDDKVQQDPGLKFIGFVKRNSIPQEYYCGDSLYLVVHQKNMVSSAKKLDALLKALIKTEMAILCWKIFSAKFNTPKIVVLLPNKIHSDKPASLSMIELSYHGQHHFWDFPTLCTQKTECSTEQIDAIDNLIDSMDLMLSPKDSKVPRNTLQKDLLPFDTLPHIYEHNIMDMLELKIIGNASQDDEQFQEMLEDKNFVEIFWKVPEEIEEKAKNAATKVKNLFPLEENLQHLVKTKPKQAISKGATSIKTATNNNGDDVKRVELKFDCVGKKSPAEDFQQLLKYNVKILQDSTLRDAKYNIYAAQMRSVIWNLIFNSSQMDVEKVANAFQVYRRSCYDFNALTDYNIWIRKLRTAIVEKKLYGFWLGTIVKHDLGPCIVGETSLEEKALLQQFYQIDGIMSVVGTMTESEEMNDTEVDDLLANI